jgi:hypothetical protein
MTKATDQQYGGLAYGTVVLFAAIAANKQRREDAVDDVLDQASAPTEPVEDGNCLTTANQVSGELRGARLELQEMRIRLLDI